MGFSTLRSSVPVISTLTCAKPYVPVVAALLMLASAGWATSIKWSRDITVTFAPGSVSPEAKAVDDLRALMQAAGAVCRRFGIEVIVLEEIMANVAAAGGRGTDRTAGLRRLLVDLGAPPDRIFEGASAVANPPWQRDATRPWRPDTVEVELVCTPGQ